MCVCVHNHLGLVLSDFKSIIQTAIKSQFETASFCRAGAGVFCQMGEEECLDFEITGFQCLRIVFSLSFCMPSESHCFYVYCGFP